MDVIGRHRCIFSPRSSREDIERVFKAAEEMGPIVAKRTKIDRSLVDPCECWQNVAHEMHPSHKRACIMVKGIPILTMTGEIVRENAEVPGKPRYGEFTAPPKVKNHSSDERHLAEELSIEGER